MKSPKIGAAKNKPFYMYSWRVLEIAKIRLGENLTHLLSVVFAKISRREKFPIYGIQGGGGLGFLVRAKIFFSDKIGARLFFSPALRAELFFFFINESYIYNIQCIVIHDYFMLNSGFRDNFMLSRQPHTQI